YKGNDDDSNGDVTKNDDGSTTVQGLQNVPIADTTPTPSQVLMFTGEQWQPIDMPSPATIASALNFVEHPQDQGRYRIAAAGLIRCDGTSEQTSYNNLVAQSRPDGYVILHFNNYQWPNEAPY